MDISFSSALPDAIQKSLGLSGGAGTYEKLAGGVAVTALAVWLLMKGLTRTKK